MSASTMHNSTTLFQCGTKFSKFNSENMDFVRNVYNVLVILATRVENKFQKCVISMSLKYVLL